MLRLSLKQIFILLKDLNVLKWIWIYLAPRHVGIILKPERKIYHASFVACSFPIIVVLRMAVVCQERRYYYVVCTNWFLDRHNLQLARQSLGVNRVSNHEPLNFLLITSMVTFSIWWPTIFNFGMIMDSLKSLMLQSNQNWRSLTFPLMNWINVISLLSLIAIAWKLLVLVVVLEKMGLMLNGGKMIYNEHFIMDGSLCMVWSIRPLILPMALPSTCLVQHRYVVVTSHY